ncbi:MAG TPA: hypothetical protein PLA50_09225 [Bacteroidia bacterium]|nr:hypothetical protein [Bacteroidia bacterium]
MNFPSRPTPPQLFGKFERGEISREELHEALACHARDLIGEMEEAHRHPRQSYLERLRNYAAARKLSKRHGTARVREVLAALGEIDGFPPAQILWNANHGDVPLHCFFRSRLEPVFRITRMDVQPMLVSLDVEYGARDKRLTVRESVLFQRNAMLGLELVDRFER